jgi:hypothetical protein
MIRFPPLAGWTGYSSVLLSSLLKLEMVVNLKSGDHFDDDNIMYAQAKTVSIKSKERNVTVTLDGEPIGILPADLPLRQLILLLPTGYGSKLFYVLPVLPDK